jgi:hypothetical protein
MKSHRGLAPRFRFWLFLCLFCLLPAFVWPVHAQNAIKVLEESVEHEFKGPMTFRLVAESSSPIQSVKLFYRVSGEIAAHKTEIELSPDTRVEVSHTEDMGDDENYQPPMITFTYWWVIEDQAGNRLKTDSTPYVYSDTRYTWQVLENDQVKFYWYDQDAEFGEEYFGRAVQAANDLSVEFGLEVTEPVTIVIYNTHQEFMSVLRDASAEWTGAVSFGDSGMIVIGLGQESWMRKVIPHEITHAILNQITQPPFGDIPRWLHEGLAVRSEGGIDREEELALEKAIREDTLISLRVLNSPFPDQRGRAILSYAQSNSLVEFIIEEHGADKLAELLAIFALGAHYDDAMRQVFGTDMDGIEDQWRAHIGASPRAALEAVTPSLEPSPTVVQVQERTRTPEATPTPEQEAPILPIAATATALAAQPHPTATQTVGNASSSGPAVCNPCLGILPALGALVFVALYRPRLGF